MNQTGKAIATQFPAQRDHPSGAMKMNGDLVMHDERVLAVLRNSGLTENLRDFEVGILASLTTMRYFDVRQVIAGPGYDSLKDALMILVEGEIEVCAHVEDEPVSLHLTVPGDLARIISFVGGDTLHVSARIEIRKGSAVLLLQRSRLETLLYSHPAIVYCVMRNLVCHVHGMARRKSAETEEMSNYIHGIHGRY